MGVYGSLREWIGGTHMLIRVAVAFLQQQHNDVGGNYSQNIVNVVHAWARRVQPARVSPTLHHTNIFKYTHTQ